MPNPMPSFAQRFIEERTGRITPAWLQFLSSIATNASPVTTSSGTVFDYMTAAEITAVQGRDLSMDVGPSLENAFANGVGIMPAGTYRCNAAIVEAAAENLNIVGAGSNQTKLYFPNASAGISLTYSDVTKPPTVSGITLLTVGNSAATALALTGPAVLTTYIEGPRISDVVIQGQTLATDTWKIGVSMSEVWYPNVSGLTVKGGISFVEPYTMAIGVQLTNVQGIFARNLYLQHIVTGILENGASLGEGYNIGAFEMVGVNTGISVGSGVASAVPGTFIGDGHINASLRGIIANNRVQTTFGDLLLYKTQGTSLNWIGILGSEVQGCLFDDIFFGGTNQAATGNGDGIVLTGASMHNVVSNLSSDYFTTAGVLCTVENTSDDNVALSETFTPAATGGAPVVAMTLCANTGTGIANRMRPAFTQGTTTAAANSLTLPYDGDSFHISGNTQINLLSAQDWPSGSVVYLHFDGTPTVKHNQVASGNFAPLMLAGSVDFVATANSRLGFVWRGSSWWEFSRTLA